MLRRLPIGPKLIGLVSALLALMLAVAAYSFVRSQGLRDRVHGLSSELIPLVRALSVVHSRAMNQSVTLERALRRSADPSRTDEELAEDIAHFESLGEEVRAGLREAKRQARDSSRRARARRDVEQLADVRAVLRVLQRDHQSLTELALEHLEAERADHGVERDAAAQQVADYRERRLGGEQVRFERDLAALLVDLEAFTETRAEGVRRREEGLFELTVENLILTVVAFFVGVIVATVITRRIVGPIRALVAGANRVTEGDLSVSVDVRTGDEVGELAGAFNKMVAELRARERVKEAFGKYLDPRIVEDVIDDMSRQQQTGGERRVMTVFFMDLERFSQIAERLTPTHLVKVINRYFTIATDAIAEHHGVVDKFIGDEVMAWWGPPFCAEEEHAMLACRAALDSLDALARFREELPELLGFHRDLPQLDVRLGLSTGELIIGSIGSERSKSYTVMGDTVNLASRLEGVNKQYGTRILLNRATRDLVEGELTTREIDVVRVVGREDPTPIYELLGVTAELPAELLELRDRFERGLAAYRAQAWDDAREAFESCLALRSDDGPSRVFLERVEVLRGSPPGEDWDAVWRLLAK